MLGLKRMGGQFTLSTPHPDPRAAIMSSDNVLQENYGQLREATTATDREGSFVPAHKTVCEGHKYLFQAAQDLLQLRLS